MRAERQLLRDRCDDIRVVVSEQQRAVTHDVVDDLIAIDIPFAAAGGARDVERERRVVPHVVCDAVREDSGGTSGQTLRGRVLLYITRQDGHRQSSFVRAPASCAVHQEGGIGDRIGDRADPERSDTEPSLEVRQFVFDVVEQVLRIADEFAVRVQREAAAKRVRRAIVQIARP